MKSRKYSKYSGRMKFEFLNDFFMSNLQNTLMIINFKILKYIKTIFKVLFLIFKVKRKFRKIELGKICFSNEVFLAQEYTFQFQSLITFLNNLSITVEPI